MSQLMARVDLLGFGDSPIAGVQARGAVTVY